MYSILVQNHSLVPMATKKRNNIGIISHKWRPWSCKKLQDNYMLREGHSGALDHLNILEKYASLWVSRYGLVPSAMLSICERG